MDKLINVVILDIEKYNALVLAANDAEELLADKIALQEEVDELQERIKDYQHNADIARNEADLWLSELVKLKAEIEQLKAPAVPGNAVNAAEGD